MYCTDYYQGEEALQNVFAGVVVLCLRSFSNRAGGHSRVAVVTLHMVAAYVATHWSVLFEPLVRCSRIYSSCPY
jgi:hypothetical protein